MILGKLIHCQQIFYNILCIIIAHPHAPVDSHPGLPAPDTRGTNTSEAQATATITSSLGIILKYYRYNY